MAGGYGYSWFEIEVVSDPVFETETPFEQIIASSVVLPTWPFQPVPGGGEHFSSFGGFPLYGRDFRQRISSRTEIELPSFSTTLSGATSASRNVTWNVAGSTFAQRPLAITLAGVRDEAEHWNLALREDEETLLLLL